MRAERCAGRARASGARWLERRGYGRWARRAESGVTTSCGRGLWAMLAWRETGCRGSWWAAEGGADVWVYGVSGTGASAGHVEAGRARELAEIDRWALLTDDG